MGPGMNCSIDHRDEDESIVDLMWSSPVIVASKVTSVASNIAANISSLSEASVQKMADVLTAMVDVQEVEGYDFNFLYFF